jgi:hypothetical protein
MTPGSYYFFFDFGGSDTSWSIDDTIIGGTPKGWNPTPSPARAVAEPDVPDACYLDDPAHPNGVHLVFGGSSGFDLGGNAAMELCPSATASAQETVLYTRKSDEAPASSRTSTFKAGSVVSSSPNGWGPVGAVVAGPPASPLYAIGDAATTTTSNLGKNATASISLAGFVPPGSTVTSVTARVAHRETTANFTNTIQITNGGSLWCTNNGKTFPSRTTMATDSVSCTPSGTTGKVADPAGVTVGITMKNTGNAAATATLDGVELDVTFTPQTLKRYTPGSMLINSGNGGGNKGVMWLQGTAYAPLASIHIDYKNNNSLVFNRGAVLGSYDGTGVPPSQTFAPFNLPSVVTYSDRTVTLTAQLGSNRIVANVAFDDTTTTPGTHIRINRWSVK